MDDFIFRGKPISDFGAVAAFGNAMKFGAKIQRGEYALPDGGTVEIGDAVYKSTQRQVSIVPADGQEATPRWRRDILAHLQGRRGHLAVLNDPGYIRIASFDAEGTYGTQGWPLGEIKLTMTLYPLCYAETEATVSRETAGGGAALQADADGALEMPVRLALTCLSGAITAASVTSGGRTLELSGLSLGPGARLVYDAGQFLGDPASLRVGGALDFSAVRRWALLRVAPGGLVRVSVTGGQAKATLTTRGRWPS